MTEKEPVIAIIGAGTDAQTAAKMLAEIQKDYPNDKIVIVENVEDLKKTGFEQFDRPAKTPEQEVFKIRNYNKDIPDIEVLTYGQPLSGKESRRERRAKERKKR